MKFLKKQPAEDDKYKIDSWEDEKRKRNSRRMEKPLKIYK